MLQGAEFSLTKGYFLLAGMPNQLIICLQRTSFEKHFQRKARRMLINEWKCQTASFPFSQIILIVQNN